MHKYPLHHSYFWERAPFFRLLIPFVFGILLYDIGSVNSLPFSVFVFIASIAGIGFAAISFLKRQNGITKAISFIVFQAFFLSLALLICHSRDIRHNKKWFALNNKYAKGNLAKIIEPPQEKDRTWKLHVQVLNSIDSTSANSTTVGETFVSIYKNDHLLPYTEGDTLLMNSQWLPIKNSGNPFEYDYARNCARKGIYYQALLGLDEIMLYGKANPVTISSLDKIHNWSNNQLTHYVKDTATLSLLQAMLLGDERNLDPDTRQAYSDTGVIHIVSISGSHVAMLFVLITWILFWIKGRHANWIKYGIGIAIVWGYVLMAGAPPSAIRSAVMFSFLALGILFSRERQPLNTLFASAFILLLAQPAWLFSVGFQLSFTAVLSLTLFYEPIYNCWPQAHWLLRRLWQAVSASLAAEILTAPLVIYYFHNLPLFTVFANIVAGLLAGGCALIGGVAILVFSWLPALATLLARLLTQVVHVFNAIVLFFQQYTFTSWKYLQISFMELSLIYIVVASTGYALLEKKRSVFKVSLAVMCLFLCSLAIDRIAALYQQRLVVYNSGKKAIIEHISGRQYTTVFADSSAAENYTTKAAHIGWYSWNRASGSITNPFIFKGKRVLVLNESTGDLNTTFPVDILMIPQSVKKLSPSGIQHTFNPKQIVLCGQQSRYYKASFADSCRSMNIRLHDVATDGALVIE